MVLLVMIIVALVIIIAAGALFGPWGAVLAVALMILFSIFETDLWC